VRGLRAEVSAVARCRRVAERADGRGAAEPDPAFPPARVAGGSYAGVVTANGQEAIARARALGVLRDAAIGDRLVVRAHRGEGAADALGTLVARTADAVTIDTRRGPVEVALAAVVAAKHVPPPPAPRTRRP
jgi:hypothetical protein